MSVVSAALLLAASAGAQQPPTPVQVTAVVERDVPASIRLVGTVMSKKSAIVASEVSGPVADVPVEPGTFVEQGGALCRIDATVAGLWLAEAKAELQNRQAVLAELENGTREEELRRLKATVEEAKAILDKWTFEQQRINALFAQNQSNTKEKHDTDMEVLAAARRLSQAQASFDAAENGPRAETIAQARYALAAQEAIVGRLARDLEKTQILAPFDGFVVTKRTEVGEWIEAGGPVCELVYIDEVKIRADVPESAIAYARPGADASVIVQALDRSFSQPITRVVPMADPSARTFPIEIDVQNEDHALLPGMFVWTLVPSGPAGKRLMVSKDAIVASPTGKQVFVVRPGPDGGSMAMPTPVTTGLELQNEVEIRAAGIRAGDQVVSRANERLRGPTPVAPMPASATSQPAEEVAGADGGGGRPGGH